MRRGRTNNVSAAQHSYHEKMNFWVIRGNTPKEDGTSVELHRENVAGGKMLGWDKAGRCDSEGKRSH